MWVFDDQSADFKVAHSYFSRKPVKEQQEGSYADKSAQMDHTVTYGWNHTFSEIIMRSCLLACVSSSCMSSRSAPGRTSQRWNERMTGSAA
jgi:hypothetical protein